MKKLLLRLAILSAALLTVSPGVMARQLSVEDAVKNAPARFRNLATRASTDVVYTQKGADINVAYVLNDPSGKGYIVLSADDVMPPVLGYADKGEIDPDNMPPALTEWLANYARLLEYALANNLGVRGDTDKDYAPVDMLCSTLWNQDSPYNDQCPTFDGNPAPSGCTATAASQVVNYHKWPEQGTGSHIYHAGTLNKDLTWNFGDTKFEWDLMIDNYANGNGTEEQRNAVATLLAAVGNASCMDYTKNSSGAWTYNAAYGIVKYMNYDKSALHLCRNYFGHDEWVGMVYNEIANKRPVLYSGYNDGGGHAFVIDGYSGNGFFHLNWGWGGSSNGYFLLTGLDPSSQGIGGSAAGYNSGQDATFYLMPPQENSVYQARLMGEGTLNTEKTTTKRSERVSFKTNGGNFLYSCIFDMTVTLGVEITPVEGGESQFIEGSSMDFKSHYGTPSMNTIGAISVKASDLPESGEFIARPAFKYNDEVFTIHYKVGQADHMILTCNEENVVSKKVTVDRSLSFENLRAEGLLYAGYKGTYKLTVANEGAEYLGYINLRAYNEKGYVCATMSGSGVQVDLLDGDSLEVTLAGDFISGGESLKAGKYTLKPVDSSGMVLDGEALAIEILEVPTGTLTYTGSKKVTGAVSGNGTQNNPYIVGDSFDIDLTFNVTSGLLSEKINYWAAYQGVNGWIGIKAPTNIYLVGAGYSQTTTYHVDVTGVDANRLCNIQAYGWSNVDGVDDLNWDVSNKSGGTFWFKRDPTAGIGDVETDKAGISPNPASDFTTVTSAGEIATVKVYGISGALVVNVKGDGSSTMDIDVSSLSAGHYVVVVETSTGTERHKLIKR